MSRSTPPIKINGNKNGATVAREIEMWCLPSMRGVPYINYLYIFVA